jgi:IclR family transcriptional regulator, mhp operon transcriptional activator
VLSGHGRAYLAFAPNASGRVCSICFEGPANPENELAFQTEKLNRILAEVRRRGYATRDSSFVGGFYGRPPHSDGLAAIAVPVCWREQVYGAINLVWLKNAQTVDHMVRHHLTDLQAAASEITAGRSTTWCAQRFLRSKMPARRSSR